MPAKQEDKIAAAILAAALINKFRRPHIPIPMRSDGEGVDIAKVFEEALKAVRSTKRK